MIQSIIFDKHLWTIISAHRWLIKHHIYPIKSPHVTKNYIHFRIKKPIGKNYVTINIGNGIMIISVYD
jgi:hypothetical protein